MELNIDPHLSVFHLTARVQQQRAMLNHRRTMNIISYEIENATLIDNTRTRIFASFQRMSRFLPQVRRYRELARRAERIYVFGIPDAAVPEIENVTYIPLLPEDQLAREWFLVSYGQHYATMLSTEETSPLDAPDVERQFKGLWTFEESLTGIVSEWLNGVVNAPPFSFAEADFNRVSHYNQIEKIKNRLYTRLNRAPESEAAETTQRELREIIQSSLPHSPTSAPNA